MYHYTYRLTNRNDGMLYIGKRSSILPPEEDVKYMGSSKYVPKEECDKEILEIFTSAHSAIEHEIYLHELHDVAANPAYYNQARQLSTGFDSTGVKRPASVGRNISAAKKGNPPKWSDAGRAIVYNNLNKPKTSEQIQKRIDTLVRNGKTKGIKSAKFRPWYISTTTVTYLFTDITKNGLSLKEGHYKKYYADLQKKFRKTTGKVSTYKYGEITDMGFLPPQYKI